MNICPGQFHLVLIGKVGDFLEHFFDVIFAGALESGNRLHLQVVLTDHKPAVVEEGCLLQQHLEVNGGTADRANLRSEGDHLPVIKRALLDRTQYRLEPVPGHRYDDNRQGLVVLDILPTNLVGILFHEGSEVHSGRLSGR